MEPLERMKEWSSAYSNALLAVATALKDTLLSIDKKVVYVAMPGCSNDKLEYYFDRIKPIISISNRPIARLGTKDYNCFHKGSGRPRKNLLSIYTEGVHKFISKLKDSNRIIVIDYISGIISNLIELGYAVIPVVMKPELYGTIVENIVNKAVSIWNPIFFTEGNCRTWVNDMKRELIDAQLFPYYYIILGNKFEIIALRKIEAIGEDGAIQDTILSSI